MEHHQTPFGETLDTGTAQPSHLPQHGGRSSSVLVIAALLLVVAMAVLQRPSLTGGAGKGGGAGDAAALAMEHNSTLDLLGPVYFALNQFGAGAGGGLGAQSLKLMDGFAETSADRLRLAVFAAETIGSEAGEERLQEVRAEANTWPEGEGKEVVLAHVDRLSTLYAGGGEALTAEDRERLNADLGWFGQIALTHGQADTEPARAALIARAQLLAVLLTVGGLGLLGAVLLGVALLVVFLVMIGRRRVTARPAPRVDSPAMLEMLVLLLVGMLGVKLAAMAMKSVFGLDDSVIGLATLGLQWSLALVVLWPVFRGGDAETRRRNMGWHRGEGVLKEVGAGVCGWLAGLPVMIACALFSLLLMKVIEHVTGRPGPPAPENPVLDMAAATGLLEMILLTSLVVIWAPVVEETVFRGGLFSWLRARGGFLIAAVVSAFVFAIIHRYPLPLLPPILALGFIFACLREWRGSLIAPVTAHFCQNAMAFTVLMILTRVAGM